MRNYVPASVPVLPTPLTFIPARARECIGRLPTRLRWILFICALICPGAAVAQVQNLRITEVDPATNEVEVTNNGAAFVTSQARPFCHRFDYASSIPLSTAFPANASLVFQVSALADADTDLFLYTSSPFTAAGNIVHGLKYGPTANVGRAALAATVGLWPSGSAFAPMPAAGTTLAWDGFGFHPADWYVDATPSMGVADVTTPSTVPSNLQHPFGEQDFESVSLGDEMIAITDWVFVNSSTTTGIFTVRAVGDVLGVATTRGASTRWLRVRDQDDGDVQNRFYTNTIKTPVDPFYRWMFWVNLEEPPPGGAGSKPRIVVQHFDGGFMNAWGVEFTATGTNLVVEGIGGPAASALLYALSSPTGVGDWVKLELVVNTIANTVVAIVNDGSSVSLPTALSATADKKQFRLCYRGEGAANINTMLIDDVSVVTDDATDAELSIPRRHALLGSSPNPFNPATTIRYDVHEPARVLIEIYNAAGRKLRTLLNAVQAAGRHRVVWDGTDDKQRELASGVYLVRLRIADFSDVGKVTLSR